MEEIYDAIKALKEQHQDAIITHREFLQGVMKVCLDELEALPEGYDVRVPRSSQEDPSEAYHQAQLEKYGSSPDLPEEDKGAKVCPVNCDHRYCPGCVLSWPEDLSDG